MRTLESSTPVFAGIAAIAVLSVMDAVIKQVSGAHDTSQVVLLRYLFGSIAAVAWVVVARPRLPTRGTFRRAGVRAVFILATAWLFFKTLTLLPLAEAVAITFTAPFFMVAVSKLLLGEPVGKRAVAAIAVGFSGVLVMLGGRLQSDVGGDPVGYLTGLGASVTYAIATVMTRRDSGHDPVAWMVLAQNAMAATLSAPVGALVWTAPSAENWLLFGVAGLLGTAGHLGFAWAYSNAPASRLAPLEYTTFLWAGLIGAVFFAEIPTVATLAGAGLIVAACMLVFGRPASEAT